MLDAKSSYVRIRGFILICNQARWSENGKLEAVLDKMLKLLYDTKPTVVRQCLGALQEVVLYRPELSDKIKEKVKEIDVTKYRDSMSPLIKKDMEALLNRMD